MGAKQHQSETASCRCGAVVLEVTGAPIVHAAWARMGLRIPKVDGVPT